MVHSTVPFTGAQDLRPGPAVPGGAPPDRDQQHDRRVRKDTLRLPSAANRRRSEGTSWPIRHLTERILQPNRPRPTMAKFLSRARSWMWPLQAVLRMKDSPAWSLSLDSPGSAIWWGNHRYRWPKSYLHGHTSPPSGTRELPMRTPARSGHGYHPCPTWRRPDNASSARPGGGNRRPPSPIAVPL